MSMLKILTMVGALSACASATPENALDEARSASGLNCSASDGLDLRADFKEGGQMIGDPLDVKIQITNLSQEAIFVYPDLDISDRSLLSVVVRDRSGNVVPSRHGDHAIIFPGSMRPELLKKLNRGESQDFIWSDTARYYFPESGMYVVEVTYRSPIPSEFYPERSDVAFFECGSISKYYDVMIR